MDNTGIIYNSFVCFVTGLTGIVVFYLLQKKRKEGKFDYHPGLDYFSLSLGVVWVLVGTRFLFLWLGEYEMALDLFKWVISPLSYLHLLPIFYYFGWSFFKDDKNKRFLFNAVFTIIAVSVVISLFVFGFVEPEKGYWGSKIRSKEITTQLFAIGIFIPGTILILLELVRRYRKWKENNSLLDKRLFGFSLGFLVYALTGLFEVIIFQEGWQVLLVRIGIMVAPFIFYFSATLEE